MNSVVVVPCDTDNIAQLAPKLLDWFDRSGRKHLPWQQDQTPYRVWVSEIMLQQTQVTTVIPYYERFTQRFPTVQALAAAPLDEVLHLWTGLGYYARARNLHRAATLIVADLGGEFPREFDLVHALPGIGRSTAGAILALAAHQRHPILDGNVKRVLSRYFGIDGFPGLSTVEERLWKFADQCTPSQRVAHYTQAIMDLGATVCVRSRPLCTTCPLSEQCVARRLGTQAQLPMPRPKKARPKKLAHIIVAVRNDGAVLLEQRPPVGIWGGLWTFPQFETREEAERWVHRSLDMHTALMTQEEYALRAELGTSTTRLPPYHHAFTHFDLELHPHVLSAAFTSTRLADEDRYRWYDARDPARVGLAKPTVELLRTLVSQSDAD